MSGMEMMLARMIGMKPEEMREKANQMTMAFTEAADALKETKSLLLDIQARLERIENGDGTGTANGCDSLGGRGGTDSIDARGTEHVQL